MAPVNTPKNRWQAVQASKQEPQTRTKNFGEVLKGYTEEQALAEASRCLNCPSSKCVLGCRRRRHTLIHQITKKQGIQRSHHENKRKEQFTRHLR